MNDEREFLHDLAGALGTAFFLTDSVIESLKARPDAPLEEVGQLTKAYESLERVKGLLQKRRSILIKREDENQEKG